MKTPVIVLITLWIIALMSASYNHGKPKKGNNNVISTIVALIIEASILYWAGLFD